MLNTLEFYFDIGKKVATARNERDESRAIFEMDYLRRALGCEKREDRPAARARHMTPVLKNSVISLQWSISNENERKVCRRMLGHRPAV